MTYFQILTYNKNIILHITAPVEPAPIEPEVETFRDTAEVTEVKTEGTFHTNKLYSHQLLLIFDAVHFYLALITSYIVTYIPLTFNADAPVIFQLIFVYNFCCCMQHFCVFFLEQIIFFFRFCVIFSKYFLHYIAHFC